MTGIYKIQSTIKPERIYIGSAIDIKRRWIGHIQDFKKNKHHSIKFQRHFNKYGESDLQFSVLLGCEKEDLIKHEQFFIDSHKPYFNVRMIANSNINIKLSDETKKKIGIANKGHKMPKENYEKLIIKNTGNKYNVGRKASIETRRRMSESRKGRISWNKGLKGCFSEETKKLWSEQKKGNKNGRYLKGIKRSSETKEKMRLSLIKSWKEGRRCAFIVFALRMSVTSL